MSYIRMASGRRMKEGRGAHLLLLDADDVLDAARVQGVWRPPAARLTTCRAHLAASGAVMLGQSGHLGGRVGTGGGRAVAGFGRHLGTRSSGTAGQDGVRVACPRRRAVLVVDKVDLGPDLALQKNGGGRGG